MQSSWCLFVFIVLGLYLVSLVKSSGPVVEIRNGKIQGHIIQSSSGESYYAFQGIPYASPPIGKRRFQAPIPQKNWDGVFNVTKDDRECYQVKTDSPWESEDCLTLNVFTPIYAPNNSTQLPVIFWIYGGGFRSGSTDFNTTGPDWLVEKDVIVVTANYRVGPFGFLSTGDLVVPGNAGLKDQQLALKWTFNNIAYFGGDVLQITIAGQSAGSASVGYHILSPGSSEYFSAAIAESGSPLNPWASTLEPKSYVVDLIKLIDSNTNFTIGDHSKILLDFLQNATAKQIDDASKPGKIRLTLPVIEPEYDGAFITQSMYESFEQGNFNKVPTIIGCNSEEQIGLLKNTENVRVIGRNYDSDLETIIPVRFQTNETRLTVAKDIKHIYANDQQLLGDFINETIRYTSDDSFTRGIIRQAELMSKYTDVYFYLLSYDGKIGAWDRRSVKGAGKVGHGEDLRYIWVFRGENSNEDLSTFPESDILTQKRILTLWTNFAKYSNPTYNVNNQIVNNVRWPKVESHNFKYLDIGAHLSVKKNPKESYLKWSDIYKKYANKPYITF